MRTTRLRDHLEKLRVVNAIGRAGSMTGAGKLLSMTQTAVSHSLKALEQALSVRLLTRSRSGVEWTEAGTILLQFSRRLYDEVDAVEAQLYQIDGGRVASLRVGAHETLAIHILPPLLEAFAASHPQIGVSIISGRVGDLVRRLIHREFHLLLTVEPTPRPELIIETIYAGYLGLYAAGDAAACARGPYPALGKDVLTLDEINRVPILTDNQAHLREGVPITSGLVKAGFTIEKTHELNSFEAAISLARRGLGIAALPDRNARAAVARGELRAVAVEGLAPHALGTYAICATYLKAEAETEARELFLAKVRGGARGAPG